ncbi:MAG: hypothetical protein V1494_06205 [Candidatus Diapherotrites archaeon]
MRIAIISSKDSSLDLTEAMQEFLETEIINAEAEVFVLPGALDIPGKAKRLGDEFELIVVCFFYSEGEESGTVSVLLEKLVDVEVASGVQVIKAVDETSAENDSDERETETEKKRLLKKWGELIIESLFPQKEEIE